MISATANPGCRTRGSCSDQPARLFGFELPPPPRTPGPRSRARSPPGSLDTPPLERRRPLLPESDAAARCRSLIAIVACRPRHERQKGRALQMCIHSRLRRVTDPCGSSVVVLLSGCDRRARRAICLFSIYFNLLKIVARVSLCCARQGRMKSCRLNAVSGVLN